MLTGYELRETTREKNILKGRNNLNKGKGKEEKGEGKG